MLPNFCALSAEVSQNEVIQKCYMDMIALVMSYGQLSHSDEE